MPKTGLPGGEDANDLLENPVNLNFKSGAAVDLMRVIDALTNLDVGDDVHTVRFEPEVPTPERHPQPAAAAVAAGRDGPEDPEQPEETEDAQPRRAGDPESVHWKRRSPDLPPVPMPEGAVPVYGDTLPDSPSYANPVVVREPGAAPLPSRVRRSRES